MDKDKSNSRFIEDTCKGVEVLFDLMGVYVENAALQEHIVAALANLCQLESNVSVAIEISGGEKLVKVIDLHRAVGQLVIKSCQLLQQITKNGGFLLVSCLSVRNVKSVSSTDAACFVVGNSNGIETLLKIVADATNTKKLDVLGPALSAFSQCLTIRELLWVCWLNGWSE